MLQGLVASGKRREGKGRVRHVKKERQRRLGRHSLWAERGWRRWWLELELELELEVEDGGCLGMNGGCSEKKREALIILNGIWRQVG